MDSETNETKQNEQARAAGKRGGDKVLKMRGPEHYRRIGSLGGKTVSRDREHMRRIGSLGGRSRVAKGRRPEPEGGPVVG